MYTLNQDLGAALYNADEGRYLRSFQFRLIQTQTLLRKSNIKIRLKALIRAPNKSPFFKVLQCAAECLTVL